MSKFINLISVLTLTGCSAAINITPPQPSNHQNKFIVGTSYDNAWNGVIDWFAENHLALDKLDKESGIVTAKGKLLVDNNELNCGDIKGSGTYTIRSQTKTLLLNVLVRNLPEGKVKVQMNLRGEVLVRGTNWDTGADISTSGACTSTGKLEHSLETYL